MSLFFVSLVMNRKSKPNGELKMRILISILVNIAFTSQLYAGSKHGIQINYDKQAFYVDQLKKSIEIYKTDSTNFEKVISNEIKNSLNTKSDILYLKKITSTFKKPKKLTVISTLHTIEINAEGLSKIVLSDFSPQTRSMKINGKILTTNKDESFESVHKKIVALLQPYKKVSFVNLLIPESQAFVIPLIALGVIGYVVYYVVRPIYRGAVRSQEIKDYINEILVDCESRNKRNPYVNYKESKTFQELQKMQSLKDKNSVTFPEVNINTQCADWSKNVANMFSQEEVSISNNEALEICNNLKYISDCATQYEQESNSKTQNNNVLEAEPQ